MDLVEDFYSPIVFVVLLPIHVFDKPDFLIRQIYDVYNNYNVGFGSLYIALYYTCDRDD